VKVSPTLTEVERLRLVVETQGLINATTLDVDEVMRVITERSQQMTDAGGGVVELVEGQEVVYRAASGIVANSQTIGHGLTTSLSGLCLRDAQPLRCVDTETDDRVDREACRRLGVRSMIVVPLVHNGAPRGVLKVVSGMVDHFGSEDLDLLQLMAGFIATALANASAHGMETHRSLHDYLTGLPNRDLLTDRLEQALIRSARERTSVGVFFIDLDGFKAVNDAHGHAAGDRLLVSVARELSDLLRANDTIARLGGDEFVLVCEAEDEWVAEIIRGRIATAVGRAAETDSAFAAATASVGDAWSAPGQRSALELMAAADAAMYLAKHNRTS
jgi:diguanylate cyclase